MPLLSIRSASSTLRLGGCAGLLSALVLAWEDAQGRTWLSINDPAWLQQRHGYPVDLNANVAGLAKLVQAAAAP